jgi:hypothetical protein
MEGKSLLLNWKLKKCVNFIKHSIRVYIWICLYIQVNLFYSNSCSLFYGFIQSLWFQVSYFLCLNFWKDTFGFNYISKDVVFDFHKRDHIRRIWEQIIKIRFFLLLVHEFAFQKNLCNKENLFLNWRYYTLKLSFFSIWLSKFWFHSIILHLTIQQQGYDNERKKFFFNKQTINYTK